MGNDQQAPATSATVAVVALRDVAREAGVSVSTASLALAGKAGVSEKTREQVRQTAERMGYKPHPYVSSLMAQVGRRRRARAKVNLAWLHHGHHSLEEDFNLPWGSRSLFEVALARSSELGYDSLEPYWIGDPRCPLKQLRRILFSRNIRGAIVYGGALKTPKLHELSDVALVKVTTPFVDSVNHHIHADMYRGVILTCTRLWKLGYRRIGLYYGISLSRIHAGNVEAAWFNFQNALPEDLRIPYAMTDIQADGLYKTYFLNLPPSDYFRNPDIENRSYWDARISGLKASFLDGRISESDVRRSLFSMVFGKWLESHRPEAIICVDSRIPDWLRNLGYRVPEDIGVVHLDVKADTPQWSGLTLHWERIAKIAVDMLDQLISRGEMGPSPEPVLRSISPSWVEGHTAPPRVPSCYAEDRYVDRWIREYMNIKKSDSLGEPPD